MTREEWLIKREDGLGGSEASSIINLNKWQTPYQLFLIKTGQVPPFTGNAKTESGQFLEDTIAKYFFHKNPECILIPTEENYLCTHADYDFILGSPDRQFIDEQGRLQVLEIKNTEYAVDWDLVPESWYCQGTFYAGTLGYSNFTICALVRGHELTYHTFDLDTSFYDYLVSECVDFWHNHILSGVAPVSTNSDDVILKYPIDNGEFMDADSEVISQHQKLIELAEKEKQIKVASEVIKEELKLKLEGCLGFKVGDKPIITWKTSKSGEIFDLDKFSTEHPDMHNLYMKEKKGNRSFLVKKI